MGLLSAERNIETKMRAAGIATPTITAFLAAVRRVAAGDRGMLPEAELEPVGSLPRLADLDADTSVDDVSLLDQLVVVKLNGGLGTSMGLDTAKSLLPVKRQDTFLDFIARQMLHLRRRTAMERPAFYLMDSFSTQKDSLAYLRKYPELGEGESLDFLQNMVPKIDATTLEPASWPDQPALEWCPPGHGDIYPSLLGSGLLDRLLDRGIEFMFVSNSDNLGATVDLRALRYFASQGLSFLMEVAERTAMDRKGGHLARRKSDGRLVLRESAQCPAEDQAAFQDIDRHRFFNTNSVWVRLDRLRAELDRQDGALPLPLISNVKPVDPRNPRSPRVLQLESAMGSAIECFDRTDAIVVPRTRFAPVKNTSDLLVLRSDACRVTDDYRLVLDEQRQGQPPVVDLDQEHYQLLADFERFFVEGEPSLVRCEALSVKGPVRFAAGVVCEGRVAVENASSETKALASGTYRDVSLSF
jgi:UDP-N-acetylglucosamine pyrophosphorylase